MCSNWEVYEWQHCAIVSEVRMVYWEVSYRVEFILDAENEVLHLEMVQGCPPSNAWLLLRRLKSFTSIQMPRNSPLEPIDLSP